MQISRRVLAPLRRLVWLGGALVIGSSGPRAAPAPEVIECQGMANASAAVRVGGNRILVGSDEDNALLLYDARSGGRPIKAFQTSPWLGHGSSAGEVDFEGAARVGDVLFWIGSHSRNKNGRYRPERQRLLALRISDEDGEVHLEPVGKVVTTLVDALESAPALAAFHLGEAARLAPEVAGALNIEGLSASATGGLWIGFRSPVPAVGALLVPVINPMEIVVGQPPKWGEPVQVDLGGKGIRDIVWTGREYFILGGNAIEGGRTRLFRWSGQGAVATQVKAPGLKDLNPEGLVFFGTTENPRLLVLSDDGNRKGNDARDILSRSFRMMWVDPVRDASGGRDDPKRTK